MKTAICTTKTLPSGAVVGPEQYEWMAQQIERGLGTRTHAKMLRTIVQDLSEPLFVAIASGSAGLREAITVRKLLGIRG